MDGLSEEIMEIESSTFQKVSTMFWQVVAIGVAVYCIYHIKENIPVIALIVLFLLFIFIISANHTVIVTRSFIEFRSKNLLFPLYKTARRIEFDEIISIETNLQFGGKEDVLEALLNSTFMSFSSWNRIKFNLGNNEKTINTKIYKSKIIKALDLVTKVTNNKIPINTISSA